MSVDQRRRVVEGHQKVIVRLQTEKSRQEAKAVTERKRALDASAVAGRIKSASSQQSKLREAQRYEANAVSIQKKIADLETKLASEYVRLGEASRQLVAAQSQEDKKRIDQQKREHASQVAELSRVQGRLSRHDQLHRKTAATLQRLQELPEQLTVLFLASNPLDQAQLRLDDEARSIHEMVRKSEHRDVVRLESRWAVQPLDVLQAINECKPGVVHFSGHGSEDDILFQDSIGRTKLVSKEAIVQTMMAASGDLQLVFFNTCFSHGQAEAIVEHVPCAIGMNASIGDTAARVFAAQFYSAIGFGHSVAKAFQQARAALLLEGIPEDQTPELFTAEGVDASTLFLVQIPG
ncbi:CHAT domain-containing protein [Xanthomonas cassavae CFBP 4642]|uniref:CHAT domain-containing protein n=1 Tax=Xanthomonas cassavae CFBP 4642 TaxID=1219375 RepID=A0ABS8HKJ5_9XANT|nr:CHAT domain-containing protein [Xanthomonas cassavae]MCC4621645.1 CHAT domain-containing protein [Xanthomonas cassavae CFBP 4642]